MSRSRFQHRCTSAAVWLCAALLLAGCRSLPSGEAASSAAPTVATSAGETPAVVIVSESIDLPTSRPVAEDRRTPVSARDQLPPDVYYAAGESFVGETFTPPSEEDAFADEGTRPIALFEDAAESVDEQSWESSPCAPLWEQQECRDIFRSDFHGMWGRLADDGCGLIEGHNTLIFGGALAIAIGLRQGPDEHVRDATDDHPERWGDVSRTLGKIGDVQYQVPVLLGLYGYSVYHHDAELHDLSGTLISAFTLTGLTTLSVKAIANTDRPSSEWNGGQFGFPSYHTASSFSIAAVLDEYYGPKVGLPAYTVAGLIGWSRIDERDHDLSDVVFGAALGWVIGKSVAGNHLCNDPRVRICPYSHPLDGSPGVAVDMRF